MPRKGNYNRIHFILHNFRSIELQIISLVYFAWNFKRVGVAWQRPLFLELISGRVLVKSGVV